MAMPINGELVPEIKALSFIAYTRGGPPSLVEASKASDVSEMLHFG